MAGSVSGTYRNTLPTLARAILIAIKSGSQSRRY
jgi:hypothetical protein